MIGISDIQNNASVSKLTAGGGALSGTLSVRFTNTPSYFARYENSKWLVAGEFARFTGDASFLFTGLPANAIQADYKEMYGMTNYKLSTKLTTGVYWSQVIDKQGAPGPGRYQKDWVVSGRYDFSQYIYAKAEEHFIKGTFNNFDMDMNPGGLKPSTKLTILKVGVSF